MARTLVAPVKLPYSVVEATSEDFVTTVIPLIVQTSVVEITTTGPQGPISTQLDGDAIDALEAGDAGQVLKWSGTQFTPTDELEQNLTITAGFF